MITLSNLSKQFGTKILFDRVTGAINPGNRTALIGPNGAGKSYLLKILMGLEQADGGSVSIPRELKLGYLAQDLEIDREISPLNLVLAPFAHLLGDSPETDLAALEQLEHERFVCDAYSLPARAQTLLAGLGVPKRAWERDIRELSGGYRMRVVLAGLLLDTPDLLLLDEPTNHLDFDSVLWLERFMSRYDGGVVIVSHDRVFLRRLTSQTAELLGGRLTFYDGPLDNYYAWKAERDEQEQRRRRNLTDQIEKNEAFVRRFKAKATKAAQARSREKQIEKLQDQLPILRAPAYRHVRMTLPPPPSCGSLAFKMEAVCAGYGGPPVLDRFDLTVRRGDHIAVVGPNGSGKSTLLKICAGLLDIEAGTCEAGHNTRIRYYSQHRFEQLDPHLSAYSTIAQVSPTSSPTFIQSLLGGFLFSGDDANKLVSVLSGGEKSRLSLASIFADPGNVLLLDEPTNHLDVETVDWLADALADFEGTVLAVSHDEDFIKRAFTSILDMRTGEARIFEGSLSEYRAHIESGFLTDLDAADKQSAVSEEPKADKEERIRRRKERTKVERRIAKVENAIAELETKLAAAQQILEDPANGSSFDLLARITREGESLESNQEKLLGEWELLHGELDALS